MTPAGSEVRKGGYGSSARSESIRRPTQPESSIVAARAAGDPRLQQSGKRPSNTVPK